MKRLMAIFSVAAFVTAMCFSHLVLAKGHVPDHKEQVCHEGEVITISANALAAHLDHGDCYIDKNDSEGIFFTGDSCDEDDCDPLPSGE